MDRTLPASSVHGDSLGKNTGVGCQFLLQGIFPTQGIEPRSPALQADIGEEQRNSSRWNEEAEPKQKARPVMDVSGGESKVWYCKEQYCIETWNFRSMN